MVPIENNPVIKKILQDFVSQSAKAFRDAVRREGLLDTEDLLNSLREGAVEVGSGFITGHVYYSELLRVKDLKELRYTTLNTRAKELRKTLSEIEKAGGKGSDNWKKYKTELKGVEDQAKNAAKALKSTVVPPTVQASRGMLKEEGMDQVDNVGKLLVDEVRLLDMQDMRITKRD